jgi:N-methylhydantoinase A
MQSNGGLIGAPVAADMPMHIIESGPAGGVVGAQAVAKKLGIANVISFDMGGTTAKASLIEDGKVTRAQEYQVGGGILTGSRLLSGDGYLLKVPAIDLAEVGAGGGSIVQVDAGGSMKVGPRSAGAVPGPVCYDTGGDVPTITDANLILGYINPEHLVGGEVKLNAARARRIFESRVAKPLGLGLAEAAFGAHRIAVANMMRAVRAVSTERGRDPRRFTLFAFGGNGPIFGALMARELGMKQVVIPPAAGLFSSFGFLYAQVESHFSKTVRALVGTVDPQAVEAAFAQIEATAAARLEAMPPVRMLTDRQATLRYRGQSLELSVPLEPGPVDAARLAGLAAMFEKEHERTFGHAAQAGEPVELASVRVVVRNPSESNTVPQRLSSSRTLESLKDIWRDCYFGPQDGWARTPVTRRDDLVVRRDGPLVVEEYDATCIVPPGAVAWLDDAGNICMDVRSN